MKINIILSDEKQQIITIQITNPKDHLFLFVLELSEIEYQNLKTEQNLLVDFQNFPNFLMEMIDICRNNENFCGILEIKNSNDAKFIIQEKTNYMKLNHFTLKFQKANDNILKNYMNNLLKEFIEKYEITLNELNDVSLKNDSLLKENTILNDQIQKLEIDNKNSIDNLFNEKNKEINLIKEENLKENKTQLEVIETEKNKKISELEEKIFELKKK